MPQIIKERFWRLVISCLYTYSMQGGGPLPMDHSCAVSWRSAGPPELLLRRHLLLVFNRKCTGRLLRISCGIYANVRSCGRSYIKLPRAGKKHESEAGVRRSRFYLCLHRSLKTASSLTYRGISTCGIPCQEVYWSCRSTPPTWRISPSTTWD